MFIIWTLVKTKNCVTAFWIDLSDRSSVTSDKQKKRRDRIGHKYLPRIEPALIYCFPRVNIRNNLCTVFFSYGIQTGLCLNDKSVKAWPYFMHSDLFIIISYRKKPGSVIQCGKVWFIQLFKHKRGNKRVINFFSDFFCIFKQFFGDLVTQKACSIFKRYSLIFPTSMNQWTK